ncbi:macrolide family glycosyltransferase [Mycobacterium sp.]|uniref:macrolide family glycosyltransferase n=1 Tax=Mycobacterium sp. TaxID=1785 RepID=UPI002B55FF03|nr:macrolide family glycosyltransferase [Mycobacterium sp.]HTY35339.1 macrolide family glycosyltransferase [Mycobacterium sp.]
MSQHHILVVNVQGHGHVYPSLGLVSELARRGHRISFVTTPLFAEEVAAVGATVVPYKSEFDNFHVPDVVKQEDAETQLHLVYIRENMAVLRAAEEGLRDDPPDLVVYDVFPFIAGRLLAKTWNRPAVRMGGAAENEHYSVFEALWASNGQRHPADVEAVHAVLVDLLTKYGIDTPVKQFWREIEDLNIIYLPKSFQVLPETFDERFVFVGPSFTGRLEDTNWQPPHRDAPVLLVSLGNLFNEHPDFFKACAQAFANTPWHVVMAIGGFLDPATLEPLPPNVEAHKWVPFHTVLEHATACLIHGTIGATMEAMDMGVPLVVMPHFATEAAPFAQHVVDLGLGYELPADQLDPANIRAVVERLVADTGVKERVLRMQRDIKESGGPARAADEIEAHMKRFTQ